MLIKKVSSGKRIHDQSFGSVFRRHLILQRRGGEGVRTSIPNKLKMAFRWRTDDGPTLYAGWVALLFSRGLDQYSLGNQLFCYFPEGGLDPQPPPSEFAQGLHVYL